MMLLYRQFWAFSMPSGSPNVMKLNQYDVLDVLDLPICLNDEFGDVELRGDFGGFELLLCVQIS